ncbi:hypothetical protein FRC09_009445, partial [Ceratobasidium sp. 395]
MGNWRLEHLGERIGESEFEQDQPKNRGISTILDRTSHINSAVGITDLAPDDKDKQIAEKDRQIGEINSRLAAQHDELAQIRLELARTKNLLTKTQDSLRQANSDLAARNAKLSRVREQLDGDSAENKYMDGVRRTWVSEMFTSSLIMSQGDLRPNTLDDSE